MEFFDSHSHYNDEKFDGDREQIIEKTYKEGITKFVCAGYNIPSSIMSLELAQKYEYIYSICGISPNDIPQFEEELWKDIDKISKIATNNKEKKLVAIGEIGLDYYWTKDNKKKQILFFEKQLELAKKYDLPVIVHARESIQDVYDILKKSGVKKGSMHCYSGSYEMALEFIKLGFKIGIDGPITYDNNKKGVELVKKLELKDLLLETDSPYLSPTPNRGKPNSPLNLKYIAEKIADIKGISIDKVIEETTKNAKELYKI